MSAVHHSNSPQLPVLNKEKEPEDEAFSKKAVWIHNWIIFSKLNIPTSKMPEVTSEDEAFHMIMDFVKSIPEGKTARFSCLFTEEYRVELLMGLKREDSVFSSKDYNHENFHADIEAGCLFRTTMSFAKEESAYSICRPPSKGLDHCVVIKAHLPMSHVEIDGHSVVKRNLKSMVCDTLTKLSKPNLS